MKRSSLYLVVTLLVLSGCKKDPALDETRTLDSQLVEREVVTQIDSTFVKLPDSIIDQSSEVERVLNEGVMRQETPEKITRTMDASERPLTFGDEIKNTEQVFVLKLTDLPKGPFSLTLSPENKEMNLRINQIRYADGSLDGPFGLELSTDNPQEGEVVVYVSKSQMASSSPVGKFTLSIE